MLLRILCDVAFFRLSCTRLVCAAWGGVGTVRRAWVSLKCGCGWWVCSGEVPAIVASFGTSATRVGFAGSAAPEAIVPTVSVCTVLCFDRPQCCESEGHCPCGSLCVCLSVCVCVCVVCRSRLCRCQLPQGRHVSFDAMRLCVRRVTARCLCCGVYLKQCLPHKGSSLRVVVELVQEQELELEPEPEPLLLPAARHPPVTPCRRLVEPCLM